MTKGRNPRDGLLKAITPSPRGAQRSSPNDSRKGSNSRALTALLESWVNDSRDSASPGKRHRDANKAPRGAGEQQTNRARREGVSRCSHLPLGSLRRFQASSNTYPNGLTPRQQTAALWRLCTTSTKGKEACAGNQSFARNEPHVTTASQGLIRRLSNWRRCWKQSRRWMHCRSPLPHPAEGDGDARPELRLQAALPSQPRRQLRNASRPGAHPRSLRRPAPRDGHSRIACSGVQAQAREAAR